MHQLIFLSDVRFFFYISCRWV